MSACRAVSQPARLPACLLWLPPHRPCRLHACHASRGLARPGRPPHLSQPALRCTAKAESLLASLQPSPARPLGHGRLAPPPRPAPPACPQLVDSAWAKWLQEEEGVVDDITAVIIKFNPC
jgi:hypothetical protein